MDVDPHSPPPHCLAIPDSGMATDNLRSSFPISGLVTPLACELPPKRARGQVVAGRQVCVCSKDQPSGRGGWVKFQRHIAIEPASPCLSQIGI